MRKLRLGVLSTARINGAILAAAAATGCFDVAAVASREAERAESFARENGIARSYGSYDGLLHDPDVDAVYISLPNSMHHEWTMRSLRAGKHVLCEKPYSRSAEEAEQAFDCAEARNLVLTEGLMYRHHPQTQQVARLVADGSIGRLRTIRAMLRVDASAPDDARLRPDVDRGSLMEAGCYCVSAARLLAGEPLRVQAEQVVNADGVDIAFHGTMRFADEVVAHIESSFVLGRDQRLEVAGEQGSVIVEAPFRPDWGGSMYLVPRSGLPKRMHVASANSYELQLTNFASAVSGEAEPLIGRADAVGQARALDALRYAAETRRVVDLEPPVAPT